MEIGSMLSSLLVKVTPDAIKAIFGTQLTADQKKSISDVSDRMVRGETVSMASLYLAFASIIEKPSYTEIVTLQQYEKLTETASILKYCREIVCADKDDRGFVLVDPNHTKKMKTRLTWSTVAMILLFTYLRIRIHDRPRFLTNSKNFARDWIVWCLNRIHLLLDSAQKISLRVATDRSQKANSGAEASLPFYSLACQSRRPFNPQTSIKHRVTRYQSCEVRCGRPSAGSASIATSKCRNRTE